MSSAGNKSPLITVLLPVHNAASYLAASIESILNQTFRDFELIIINDGSTDNSANIISSFSDPRMVLVNNGKNLGLIASLNKGITLAKGKYIARMDADDISLPERFQKQVAKMESDPGIAALASFVDFINEDGEITGVWNTDREAVSEKEIRSLMQKTNCIAHPSVMMHTATAKKFLYRQKQKGAEDWDLWMRILADGKRIEKLPEVLLHYRIHPASVTAGDKAAIPLERRLMKVKTRFIFGQIAKLKINGFYFGVKISAAKNLARHLVSNVFPRWGRDVKRYLTSPPWKVIAEEKAFRKALEAYPGRHFFVFPYMHVGGAEKVHADIVAAISDQGPLVIFSNFSDNKKFLRLFTANATVLDVAHFMNYPLTRKKAKRLLAEKINSIDNSVFFGSNAGLFYEVIPQLKKETRIVDLIHAFKYQPGANIEHAKLLALASRISKRVFVSGAAKDEFEKFSFHHNIPKRLRERLIKITNGITVIPENIKPAGKNLQVLFVGRNSPEKRLEIYMELAGKLPGFLFSVVGCSLDDARPVNFWGEITDEEKLHKIYGESDFLLVTSSREGFPMVIMEAMMHGLIVISTPVGDIPNHLNGENGMVISSTEKENVIREMTERLIELGNDQDRFMKMKQAARKYAVENFSKEKFEENYRKLLL
jgi:glycosyltransferase involved in cell wall biosynthesis